MTYRGSQLHFLARRTIGNNQTKYKFSLKISIMGYTIPYCENCVQFKTPNMVIPGRFHLVDVIKFFWLNVESLGSLTSDQNKTRNSAYNWLINKKFQVAGCSRSASTRFPAKVCWIKIWILPNHLFEKTCLNLRVSDCTKCFWPDWKIHF